MIVNNYEIRKDGMGGFLNPPGDPEHFYHVHGYHVDMSLSAALTDSDVPEGIKAAIRDLYAQNTSENTAEWRSQVHSYFRHCYSPDGQDWNVSNVVIDKTDSLPVDRNCAVHWIRKFYPDYDPYKAGDWMDNDHLPN